MVGCNGREDRPPRRTVKVERPTSRRLSRALPVHQRETGDSKNQARRPVRVPASAVV